jgi:hypothetical protein
MIADRLLERALSAQVGAKDPRVIHGTVPHDDHTLAAQGAKSALKAGKRAARARARASQERKQQEASATLQVRVEPLAG